MTSPAFSRVPKAPRSDDVEAVEALAQALAAVDFSADAIATLLGPGPSAALERDHLVPARHRVRRVLAGEVAVRPGQRRLAGAVDLFMLGGATSQEGADAVLGQGAFEALRALNLLEEAADGRWVAAVDLSPHASDAGAELWVASDLGAHQRPGALRRDHVLGIGRASLTLAQFTERRPVGSALDLGTGCGVQLFHLLAHARRVTATDVSLRALAFARFNLVLNAGALGLDPARLEERVELLEGSLLEPVAGREFDLVVSNPPFVITPRRAGEAEGDRYTYRDGGLPGDQLISALLEGLPGVLAPGGRAQLLGNWEIHETGPDTQEEWDVRPRGWIPATADAWVIQREELTPEDYAETWLRDASQQRDPEAFEAASLDYAADFASRGVAGVGFGMIWLRRPAEGTVPGAASLRRFEEIGHPVQQPLAPAVTAAVEAHDALSRMDDAALRAAHLTVAEDVTEERHQRPGAEHPGVILLRQGAGLRRTELLSTEAAGFVSACDGELSAGQILDALGALLGWEGEGPASDLLLHIWRLAEHGFLELPARS
ncbi:methyltransferase [Rothia sp. AR01]|uniref:Methyltransferase n=1 Tax=Rothia santali TaxID=2949643 RepID=A0A9X2HMC1_9MICC|nr:methyltransferase [Rothia santali]MCP3426988.1 methyltransferase [Rothia santali]